MPRIYKLNRQDILNKLFWSLIFLLLMIVFLYASHTSKSVTNNPITNNMEINSELTSSSTTLTQPRIMLVAGGCFWCVEADLEKLPGVLSVISGYADGTAPNPTYENYTELGFREAVKITYNPTLVTFEQILIYALKHLDPTDAGGSFHDRGEQYAPAFYYGNTMEKEIIENLISDMNNNGPYDVPLAIDVLAESTFWPAEDYHQDYYKKISSKLKYSYYRRASGRDDFIKKYWGNDTGPTLSWRKELATGSKVYQWTNYSKPDKSVLKLKLPELAYKVTQEEETEHPYSSPLDKNEEVGIYVDILSGEPLFSSRDKFNSGTGWPSFVKPITTTAVTEKMDKKLFSTRTEIRSTIADNHLGHVFSDGPKERGGLRYCMNGVALDFIPKTDMVESGYGDFLSEL